MRIDKWLWAARIFRTRTQATAACRSGHVKMGGQALKPSHEVRLEEVLTVQMDVLQRTLRVTGLSERRVGAPVARTLVEDLTSPEEQERARAERAKLNQGRPPGMGRPTKRDRRLWERWILRPDSSQT